MRRWAHLTLPLLFLLFTGCSDRAIAPEPDLTASFAKGGKPGKPGGGGDPTPADPAIAFVASSSSTDGSGINNDLMVVDVDGGHPTVLVHSETDALFFPSWSPDLNATVDGFQGSLVYERWPNNSGSNPTAVELHIVDVEVLNGVVTAANDRLFREDALVAAWSPSGDAIAFISGYPEPVGLVVGTADGLYETLLVADPYPGDASFDVDWPAWSPDGDRVAYRYGQYSDGEPGCSIRVRDYPSGANEIIVADHVCARGIDWSRDGTMLAYKDGSGMKLVNVAGTATPTPIASTLWTESPSWAPEGSSVLVYMTRNGKSGAGKRRIVRYDRTTGSETLIIERKGYHLWEPDWRRY